MTKTISELTVGELATMANAIKAEFIEKGYIKKPKYVRKKGPWK